jgi:glyoxylase I family protein
VIKIRDIDHLVLRVVDAQKMVDFYQRVFGAEIARHEKELGLIQLRTGRSMLDLVPVDGKLGNAGGAAPGKEARNLDHFCFRVEPFDEAAIRKHLASLGIEAGETAQRVGAEGTGPSIYITDPEGNTVELKGPPDTEVTVR